MGAYRLSSYIKPPPNPRYLQSGQHRDSFIRFFNFDKLFLRPDMGEKLAVQY